MDAVTVSYPLGAVTVVADHRGDRARRPVVFLHGGGQTRHSWGGSAERLAARGWHTITLDARGHGDSDWAPEGDYRLRAMAEDVLGVVAGLEQPPVVVGASLGGLTSLLLEGHLAPGTCAALVLVDIVPNWNATGGDRIRDFMAEHMDEGFASLEDAARAVGAYNPHRPPPSDLNGLRKNLRERDGRWYWHWDPQFINPSGGPDKGASEIADREQLLAWTEQIDVPMMLVRGRTSDVVSATDAEVFLQRFPDVAFVDVSGAGHMVAGDRNDAFTDAIVEFLARLD